ncbi:MAG: tRNA preQ1(34) S-adenosylmethionine ribosyltransferase-isomerase QueA [Gemmataceae bacterium]
MISVKNTKPGTPSPVCPMHFFDYELPDRLIAQEPAAERDAARLLVIHRQPQTFEHRTVRDLPDLLTPGDLIVFNDTKVIPARLIGCRTETGGKWECLFVRECESGEWEVMSQTRGYAKVGETFRTDTGLTLELTGRTADKHWLIKPHAPGNAHELLAKFGHIPLPPYIRKGRSHEGDDERYQTVYAEQAGSVAAPTAGLHFTPGVLKRLAERGIDTARVTLHVGLGTFAPVKTDDSTQHAIHGEWCEVTQPTLDAIQRTKTNGGRVIAIGTTTTRTLETAKGRPFRGESKLFIHPPYDFNVITGLMTNFHLPRTTLLLLVQAFAGTDLLKRAYEEAIRQEYRFYSYGDAMLIL